MCGIAGIAEASGGFIDPTLLTRMVEVQRHRGPDGQGQVIGPAGTGAGRVRVGLGHARLSIIDLAGGAQPLANADESLWVVFNGEIYNLQALRGRLEGHGCVFRTRSDTECLLHAYAVWGDDCVRQLRGMFAFALWDVRSQRLLLARDRLGKKPLVYAQMGSRFVFASELQALLEVPELPVELDPGALGDYLAYGYVPAPASAYRAVRKLLPGHRLIWEQGEVRLERYWQLDYTPKHPLSLAAALEELEARLTEATRLRLIADVPLGALLSGGVDSGTIVALMARLSGARVKTFSIGFEESGFDELPGARRIAQRYGTDHHEMIVRPDAAAVMPQLIRHYGEPYADASALPTYYVSRLAREHVTVALNGDGGDEVFGGYDRYRAMWLTEAARASRWGPAWAAAGGFFGALPGVPLARRQRWARFCEGARLPAASRYARWMGPTPGILHDGLLDPVVAEVLRAQRTQAVEEAFEAHRHLALADAVMATDVQTYLPNDLLVKMDIASMANSLEMRSPLLDQEVVEFVARLPADWKLRGGVQQKYLLKRFAQPLLPAQTLQAPKKGFGVPVGRWLRTSLRPWMEDLLTAPQAETRRLVRPQNLRALMAAHVAGRVEGAQPLWMLMMLELWFRTVRTQRQEARLAC
jgi:asparagine synthase (glutamine-hydrolysing)